MSRFLLRVEYEDGAVHCCDMAPREGYAAELHCHMRDGRLYVEPQGMEISDAKGCGLRVGGVSAPTEEAS